MNHNKISEKLKREVMLVLLEGLCMLLRDDFSEKSFHSAMRVWKKILVDLSSHTLGDENPYVQLLGTKPKLYRISRLYRPWGFRGCYLRAVPFIRLSGQWLENYGFDVGQRFAVYSGSDYLLLKRFSYQEKLGDRFNA